MISKIRLDLVWFLCLTAYQTKAIHEEQLWYFFPNTIPNGINPNVNVIALLEFELTYNLQLRCCPTYKSLSVKNFLGI